MAEQIFTAQDLRYVISREELAKKIEIIILSIRNSDSSVKDLRVNLEKFKALGEQLDKSSLESLISIYKQIQTISLRLRSLLNNFQVTAEKYDSIGYAFYFDNVRYNFEELSLDWLNIKDGTITLDLEKAIESTSEGAESEIKREIQEIFTQHYSNYFNAISGTYNGIIGRGGALNQGHITEAYESHLAEHHSISYNFLNSIYSQKELGLNNLEKYLLTVKENIKLEKTRWDRHENMLEAWKHIRTSLGTQRGTVAGDVGRYQVKRGTSYTPYGKQVRLTTLRNLETGIKRYSAILSDEPANIVADRIAMYITEPASNMSAKILNNITDEKVRKLLEETLLANTKGMRRI